MASEQPLRRALSSWRTLSVSLLSFSSGLPLGLIWIAIPDWMRKSDVDIRIVGLFTLTQAPWIFKTVWSPLMDRYAPPWLGRRRGWIALLQIVLAGATLLLSGLGDRPDTIWVLFSLSFAIAFAAASQDIVIDAYAVEALRKEEYGVAVGARLGMYRVAMLVAGAISIGLAAMVSWPVVVVFQALLYVPMLLVTLRAPDPEVEIEAPRSLRRAVWEPFLGFLGRHRALEILAFVFLYKFADQLAQSLQRPFLFDMGYGDFDRGPGLGLVGVTITILGALLGGALTTTMGLGHALWLFGSIQIASNAGFILLSMSETSRPLMYGTMGFEAFASGLGMSAFGVLLMRLTQKRFSATQYALFSSLFGLPRVIAGPITGVVGTAAGWTQFFWLTLLAGVPGMILLARFVPLGMREPRFEVRSPVESRPLRPPELAWRGFVGGLATFAGSILALALLGAVGGLTTDPPVPFAPAARMAELLVPRTISAAFTLAGCLVLGLAAGLFTAAAFAARAGASAGEIEP